MHSFEDRIGVGDSTATDPVRFFPAEMTRVGRLQVQSKEEKAKQAIHSNSLPKQLGVLGAEPVHSLCVGFPE